MRSGAFGLQAPRALPQHDARCVVRASGVSAVARVVLVTERGRMQLISSAISYDPPPTAVVRVLDRYAAAGMHKAFDHDKPLFGGACQLFKERKPGTSIRFADRNNFIEFEVRRSSPLSVPHHNHRLLCQSGRQRHFGATAPFFCTCQCRCRALEPPIERHWLLSS